MAKQPCSWWPAEGETRLSKRHDKVASGGEQVIGPYERNPVVASLTKPREIGDKCGSRARGIWAKAMDGAKTLEVRHLWTRRRIGNGTITQSTVEQERSVSTPAMQAQRRPSLGAPVTAKPISVTREVVERRAEVGGGRSSEDRPDNITVRSEGPLAGWRLQQPRRNCRGASRVAGAGGQPEWRRGMPPVDCPGEGRMRENLMSGLGRGSWKRVCPAPAPHFTQIQAVGSPR